MTAHLTHEELTNRLLSEPSMTVDAHLLDCEGCRKELDQLRSSVALFRDAAHGWSENAASVSQRVIAIAPRRKALWTAEWAVAAALLLVVVILPMVYWQNRGHNVQSGSITSPADTFQAQVDKDNEMLSAVNSEIAESVPAPMQPLRVSLSYGSTNSANQAK
jgi:predicted anti-sigma-YlaC factor YlaD